MARVGMHIGLAIASGLTALAVFGAAPTFACAADDTASFLSKDNLMFDEVIDVRICGFLPEESISVSAYLYFSKDHVLFSENKYAADSTGGVDLNTAKPLSGTYFEASPMGWFWSMRGPVAASGAVPVIDYGAVVLFARSESGRKASKIIRRNFISEGVAVENIQGHLSGKFFIPKVKKGGAIILLGGSDGYRPDIEAGLLASRGYPALALDYFGKPGLPASKSDVPLEYIQDAVSYVVRETAGPIGIIGWSTGAELALVSASLFSSISFVVAYAPSSVISGANRADLGGGSGASWTYQGRPLPFFNDRNERNDALTAQRPPFWLRERFKARKQDEQAYEKARIHIEDSKSNVMMVSGDQDAVLPSADESERILSFISRDSNRIAKNYIFKGAGHDIGAPFYPKGNRIMHDVFHNIDIALGGNASSTWAASQDSWRAALGFVAEQGVDNNGRKNAVPKAGN